MPRCPRRVHLPLLNDMKSLHTKAQKEFVYDFFSAQNDIENPRATTGWWMLGNSISLFSFGLLINSIFIKFLSCLSTFFHDRVHYVRSLSAWRFYRLYTHNFFIKKPNDNFVIFDWKNVNYSILFRFTHFFFSIFKKWYKFRESGLPSSIHFADLCKFIQIFQKFSRNKWKPFAFSFCRRNYHVYFRLALVKRTHGQS